MTVTIEVPNQGITDEALEVFLERATLHGTKEILLVVAELFE